MVTRNEVLALLVDRIATVMATAADRITEDSRFDEDLHADSLDLVEVVEGVERDLRGRGVDLAVADDDLAGLHTVGDVADRIAAAAS